MTLTEWLADHGYGTAAKLAQAVSEHVGRTVSKQLLNSYKNGASTPPADVIKAIRIETSGQVRPSDWIALAISVGRTNVAASGRPVRPYRPRAKPAATKRKAKPTPRPRCRSSKGK